LNGADDAASICIGIIGLPLAPDGGLCVYLSGSRPHVA
jgi:hypothetical protein